MFVPAISPDGGTVAVDRVDPRTASFDIWLHDLAHTTDTRFTFDPMQDFTPAWSPDGSRVAFISNRNGQWGLYQKPSSNVGKEELLFESPESKRLTDWSRDGRFLIFTQTDPKTDQDIWVFPMTGERKPVPFLQTDFNEGFARLSPDGRWLAYDSNETSRGEVYVHTFPGQEGKWQISTNGGSRPVWSRDGKELFYVAADLKLMAVAVKGGSRFDHGVPKPLFEARLASPFSQFDVSPDGKRFLMASPIETSANPPMTVVTNWPAGIKR
jgi:Tol biopolymer transport system component